jgi:hypothetical protein
MMDHIKTIRVQQVEIDTEEHGSYTLRVGGVYGLFQEMEGGRDLVRDQGDPLVVESIDMHIDGWRVRGRKGGVPVMMQGVQLDEWAGEGKLWREVM